MLCFITAVVVKKGLVTRKLLQALIGCWTHILLFRRPAFSVLDKVYQEGASFHEDLVFKMSKQCRAELMSLCLIAPTLQTDMRVRTAPEIFMLDASPFGGGICRAAMPSAVVDEFWRHSEQRGFYTKLQQGVGLALREIGMEHCETFGGPEVRPVEQNFSLTSKLTNSLRDNTIAYDCIELFAGVGNWSKAHARRGLRVHPGVERTAVGRGYGDLFDNRTFRDLAHLAYSGAVKEWHAAPPCWSFGTLRRPRLRSKLCPAGFNPEDKQTKEQTLLAVRTAFILFLALGSGSFISCEQPGGSVMFELQIFQRLIAAGCALTKFCFCSYGSGFQKASKWLHNKPWCAALGGACKCPYKGCHFTVQGTFTTGSIELFEARCRPSAKAVYGKTPRPGEAVSAFSASYPIPLCEAMSAGSLQAHSSGPQDSNVALPEEDRRAASVLDPDELRPWHDDPEWIEDVCESVAFSELFRYRFKKSGHINCLECRVYKSWLKHVSKCHPQTRVLGLLDSRVTMGAAAKGRSSSPALSRILRGSLGYILGGCLYPGTLHCRSQWNRADGPSRDSDVPGPSRPEPLWLEQLRVGRTSGFDTMIASATWIRPLGRWYRLLLLLAGDV